jgi:hypothetical protein
VGTRYALLLAPLSLVQAIGSTTTLFVFAFGILLSIFFPTLGHEGFSPTIAGSLHERADGKKKRPARLRN